MANKLKGVHVWWTKPAMDDKVDYYMADHQLITLMLSAIHWKKLYGEIVLYTDEIMVDFLKKTGIYDLNLWNEINTDVIENIPSVVNPSVFWAGAKLFVMKELEPPFVSLDVDVRYKQYYQFDYGQDVMFFHYEDRTYPYYPPPILFIEKEPEINYQIPHFSVNSSSLFVNSSEFLKEYTDASINFMLHPEHNEKKMYDHFSVRMIFAEQDILGALLTENAGKYNAKPIIKDIYQYTHGDISRFYPNERGESNFHSEIAQVIEHTWGDKNSIDANAYHYKAYMMRQVDLLYQHEREYEAFMKAFTMIQQINGKENYLKKFSV